MVTDEQSNYEGFTFPPSCLFTFYIFFSMNKPCGAKKNDSFIVVVVCKSV